MELCRWLGRKNPGKLADKEIMLNFTGRLNFRKSITVVGIASSLVLVSACGTASTPPVASPSESSMASMSAEPSTTPSATASTVPVSSIPVKGPANNGKGEYLQTTISSDDPAMKYNPDVVMPDALAKFSVEDITAAQQVAMTFLAEEGIDSTLNDGKDVDAWFAVNKEKIAPELQAPVYDYLKAGKTFVATGSWDEANKNNLTYSYVPGKPRVKFRQITVTKVQTEDAPAGTSLIFHTDVQYIMAGSTKDITVKGTMMYAVRKDAATGKWLITGQKSNYEGFVKN